VPTTLRPEGTRGAASLAYPANRASTSFMMAVTLDATAITGSFS